MKTADPGRHAHDTGKHDVPAARNEDPLPGAENHTLLLPVLRTALLVCSYIFLASTYFSIAVNSLSMGLMAALWLGIMVVERRWGVVRTPLDPFFIGFLVVQAVSTLFSFDPLQSLIFSKRVLLVGLVYFFASTVVREQQAKRLVAVLLGTATIVAMIGLVKLVLGSPEENVRLSIFQFYMTTSELMTTATVLLFPFVIHPRTPPGIRWAALVALVPVSIALWATVTRGAYLAAACGLAFTAIVRNKKILIPLILILILVVVFAPPYVQNRISSIVDLNHPENVSRLLMWKAGIEIFKDHPFVGVGDIDYGVLLDRYADPALPRVWGHLHNTPLQILVNYGVLGFVIIMGMFAGMFTAEWKIYAHFREQWFKGSFALGALAVLVAFFVNGLTEWSFGDQEVITLVWTTLGLVLSLKSVTTSS
jgi:putative inorganic carbon (hco3(-)) transporter